MKPAHLRSSQGNRCGHDPKNPRLGSGLFCPEDESDALNLTAELAARWFHQPQHSPVFRGPRRQIRSERREACLAVLNVLLRHLDDSTLRVGLSTPGDGFIGLGLKAIAIESGLGERRCQRALARLKAAGLVTGAEPAPVPASSLPLPKCASLRAVRVINPEFLINLLMENHELAPSLLAGFTGERP